MTVLMSRLEDSPNRGAAACVARFEALRQSPSPREFKQEIRWPFWNAMRR